MAMAVVHDHAEGTLAVNARWGVSNAPRGAGGVLEFFAGYVRRSAEPNRAMREVLQQYADREESRL